MAKGFVFLVPRTGLEPAHLAALPPEDSASTNFAIWAGANLAVGVANIQRKCLAKCEY